MHEEEEDEHVFCGGKTLRHVKIVLGLQYFYFFIVGHWLNLLRSDDGNVRSHCVCSSRDNEPKGLIRLKMLESLSQSKNDFH